MSNDDGIRAALGLPYHPPKAGSEAERQMIAGRKAKQEQAERTRRPETVKALRQALAEQAVQQSADVVEIDDRRPPPECSDDVNGMIDAAAAVGIRLRFDVLSRCLEIDAGEGWRQANGSAVAAMQEQIRLSVRKPGGKAWDQHSSRWTRLLKAAEQSDRVRCNPLSDDLKALAHGSDWAGEDWAGDVLPTLFEVEDHDLARELSRLIFWQMIARLFEAEPQQLRPSVVLQAGEGVGKSEFLKHLLPKAHRHRFAVIDSELPADPYERTRIVERAWLVEWAEITLSDWKRNTVTGWLTRSHDPVRRMRADHVEDVPRSFAIVGTTNDRRMLHDDAGGNTRFAVCRLRGRRPEFASFDDFRSEVETLASKALAHAASAWIAGERWTLSEAAEEKLSLLREESRDADLALEDALDDWLAEQSGSFSSKDVQTAMPGSPSSKALAKMLEARGWIRGSVRTAQGPRKRWLRPEATLSEAEA